MVASDAVPTPASTITGRTAARQSRRDQRCLQLVGRTLAGAQAGA